MRRGVSVANIYIHLSKGIYMLNAYPERGNLKKKKKKKKKKKNTPSRGGMLLN